MYVSGASYAVIRSAKFLYIRPWFGWRTTRQMVVFMVILLIIRPCKSQAPINPGIKKARICEPW